MKERHGSVAKVHRRPARHLEAQTAIKWRLLRAAPGFRPWSSIDECRRCVLCEQTFSGRDVQLVRDSMGFFQLRCPTPGCASSPSQWIHPGNPLISEEAWRDWVKLLDSLCEEPIQRPAPPPSNTAGRPAALPG